MHSQITELSPVEVEVKVEVPWERVSKDLDESYRKLGREARVRGFRPGKVPANVVRQLFGRQVKSEVTATLIEEALMAAVQEHELHIVARPSVDEADLEQGKPFSFKAKVEVRPKVEAVDTSKLNLVRPSEEVADAAIDEEIERLRLEHSELRVPEPMRAARSGDQLTIDYKVEVDGEAKGDLDATDRPVELGRDAILPELDEGLSGAKLGEHRDIDVTFAEDHGRDDLKGKTARFHVTVKEIRERILPEVDDEFAKDCGEYESLLELRLKIRERLESMAKRRTEAGLKEQLIDRLIDTNEIPVPPSMVVQQEHQMMYELASFMQMTGAPMPMTDEVHASMKGRAERKVKAAILLGALARIEGIQTEQADVEAKLNEMATASGKHIAKVRAEHQGERMEDLQGQILEEKLMSLLMSRAVIRDGDPEAADAAASGEEGAETEKPKKKAAAKKAAATATAEKPKKKAATKKAAATTTAEKPAKAKAATKAKATKSKDAGAKRTTKEKNA